MSFDDLKAKNQPLWLFILLIIMIIGLLVFIFNSKTDLERQIDQKQPTIALFSKDGNVQLFNPKGVKINKCGKVEDLISDEDKRKCGIGVGKVVSTKTITFEIVKVNPVCERDTVGGYVFWYHKGGPVNGFGPCHIGQHVFR